MWIFEFSLGVCSMKLHSLVSSLEYLVSNGRQVLLGGIRLGSSTIERVWDGYKKEHFKLKALMFITITDLPGLGSLSGQVTKGYKGCVVCLDGTSTKFLKHSKKIVYMGHHRFLPSTHPYRKKNPSMGQ